MLEESCTEVFLIEKKNEFKSKNGRIMPNCLVEKVIEEKHKGAKASRD